MTRIVRRHAMTIDALRERLKKVMAKPQKRREPCPKCSGTGELVHDGPMTNMDVERGAGIKNQTVSKFLKGGTMTLASGLQLVSWLDRLEDPLSVLDDDGEEAARSMEEAEREAARRRAVTQVAGRAGAAAGIDAINRPAEIRS